MTDESNPTEQQAVQPDGARVLGWQLARSVLGVPGTLSNLDQPDEFLKGVARALADLLKTDVHVRWARAHGGQGAPAAPDAAKGSAYGDGIQLQVHQQGSLLATLHVAATEPLSAEVEHTLQHLASDLTLHVDARTTRILLKTVSELRNAMTKATLMNTVARGAAEVVCANLGAEAALVLLRKTDEFMPLATVGAWSADAETQAAVEQVAKTGLDAPAALRHGQSLVTVPISSTQPARCLLVLRFSPDNHDHDVLFPLLNEVASVAAPALMASWRDHVLTALLELNRATEDTGSAEMYARMLRTALLLVPGADSGSLLARTNPNAPFTYQAAVGFDLKALSKHSLTEEAARAWYGTDGNGWGEGLPRILASPEVNINTIGTAVTPHIDPEATRYKQIQATLCLPVLRDGKVMAILDLDNQNKPDSFGEDSLQLAHLFGPPLASLLHRQRTRELLHKAAMTDDLTGLANRRAFNEALEREVQRARRGGSGPSVLHMDLKGFKSINDSFGHDEGDTVLKRVANAIRANIRTIDIAARYGGDEFMGLLIDTPFADASKAADRIQEAVAKIDVGLGPVRIDIGVTSYDTDGGHTDDVARLMKLSDARMYRAKRAVD